MAVAFWIANTLSDLIQGVVHEHLPLRPGNCSSHFPFVCFGGDATAVRTPLDSASLGAVRGLLLQQHCPWLGAGSSETFQVPLELSAGPHRFGVIADPDRQILENEGLQDNNRLVLEVEV